MTTNETIKNIMEQLHTLFAHSINENEKTENGILQFTNKEIAKMPKHFRIVFKEQNCVALYRKRTGRRYTLSYEIRYRKNGYNISVSAPTLAIAKQRFIEKIKTATPKAKNENNSIVPKTFQSFAQYYFENYRWRKICAGTKRNDQQICRTALFPTFNETALKNITTADCQKLVDDIFNKGTPKQGTEVFNLLNHTLKMAVKFDLISRNPCDIVFVPKYEKQHGKALTKDEEHKLLTETANTPYQLMFALALYTGMRPNEYKTAVIDGNFIKCVNSKQKGGNVHYKRIPITPMLKSYLNETHEIKMYHTASLTERYKEILPDHKLYDMRTTFYTRCQECGVSEIARNLFVGHSLKGLANTYTDISDEYLLKEGAKLDY